MAGDGGLGGRGGGIIFIRAYSIITQNGQQHFKSNGQKAENGKKGDGRGGRGGDGGKGADGWCSKDNTDKFALAGGSGREGKGGNGADPGLGGYGGDCGSIWLVYSAMSSSTTVDSANCSQQGGQGGAHGWGSKSGADGTFHQAEFLDPEGCDCPLDWGFNTFYRGKRCAIIDIIQKFWGMKADLNANPGTYIWYDPTKPSKKVEWLFETPPYNANMGEMLYRDSFYKELVGRPDRKTFVEDHSGVINNCQDKYHEFMDQMFIDMSTDTTLFIEGEITKTTYISGYDTLTIMDSVRFRTNNNQFAATLLFQGFRTLKIMNGPNKGTECLINKCAIPNSSGGWSPKAKGDPTMYIPVYDGNNGKSNRKPKIIAEGGSIPASIPNIKNGTIKGVFNAFTQTIDIKGTNLQELESLQLSSINGKVIPVQIIAHHNESIILSANTLAKGTYLLTLNYKNETQSCIITIY